MQPSDDGWRSTARDVWYSLQDRVCFASSPFSLAWCCGGGYTADEMERFVKLLSALRAARSAYRKSRAKRLAAATPVLLPTPALKDQLPQWEGPGKVIELGKSPD